MLKYAINRTLMIIPTLIVIVFTIFMILNIIPGDPARMLLGNDAPQYLVDQLNYELGLNNPVIIRFFNYIFDVVRGDFGMSYRLNIPVFDALLPRFPTTLTLAILSVAVTAAVGIPLGIISAVRQYSALDYSLTVGSLVLASIPSFVLAMMLILIFSLWLGVLPSSGIGSLRHFILPVIAQALPTAARFARMARASMIETIRQDYIRTAKAKGAGKMRVIIRHALKPALLPIVTVLGMNFAGLLGGAMITEVVFGLPGVGDAILTATMTRDAPVILASTIFLAAIFKFTMLLIDILQAVIDPRLKAQFK